MPVAVEETYSGNYIVVFDPIDGSANIDTSLTTGSIFGIYGPDKQCIFDIDDDSTVRFKFARRFFFSYPFRIVKNVSFLTLASSYNSILLSSPL